MEFDFSALSIAARCKAIAKRAGALDEFDDTPSKYGFPACTSLGGYTLVYYTQDGAELCAKCMDDYDLAENKFGDSSNERVIGVDTYDEGPPLFCANCNAMIESSYGDPDNPDD